MIKEELSLCLSYLTKETLGNHSDAHAEEYLVTALVPSETACLASSPGRRSLTAVWTSRDERVCFLL